MSFISFAQNEAFAHIPYNWLKHFSDIYDKLEDSMLETYLLCA